ncbi:MAG TPA: glycine cleavage T C-terminal barrel domain-containing protein [Candidatus Binatia bacterium]|nr:glycine cleavage T C-terminal barrel domain-containing protein [Candidatus Binatia bacterium]
MASPLSEQHNLLGARLGTYFGLELPAGYSPLESEWTRGRETAALFDTNYHAVFELSGADRARYLNAVTSGDIRSLQPGGGALGLLLNAQGHIVAELETYALEDRFLLLSHAVAGQRTFETLDKYIIMDDCTLTDVSAQWASCALEGPRAEQALATACGVEIPGAQARMPAPPTAAYAHKEVVIGGVNCRVLRKFHFGLPGAEILAPRNAVADVWAALAVAAGKSGGGPIGWQAINALRIEAGVRWFSYDFDDTVIPHEAGLEQTHISYTKGCYTGQEIVERVRSRGRLNRWLSLVEFSGSAPPERGTKLLAEGKEWGQVTSSSYSPGRKKGIGFAYLRKEHNTAGAALEYAGGTARVLESPAPTPADAPRPTQCE